MQNALELIHLAKKEATNIVVGNRLRSPNAATQTEGTLVQPFSELRRLRLLLVRAEYAAHEAC